MPFCRLLIFFQIQLFSKFYYRNIIRVSNSLYPDQARRFVGPDLGPNCLQGHQQTTLEGKDLKRHNSKMHIFSQLTLKVYVNDRFKFFFQFYGFITCIHCL